MDSSIRSAQAQRHVYFIELAIYVYSKQTFYISSIFLFGIWLQGLYASLNSYSVIGQHLIFTVQYVPRLP